MDVLPMPPEASVDIERRLTEIRDDLRALKGLLVGTDGNDGVLGRLTEVEQRHSFMRTCYLWLLFGVFSLFYMVVPAYFRQRWTH